MIRYYFPPSGDRLPAKTVSYHKIHEIWPEFRQVTKHRLGKHENDNWARESFTTGKIPLNRQGYKQNYPGT